MTGKIFRSTLAASLTVLLASLLVITGCLYTYLPRCGNSSFRQN